MRLSACLLVGASTAAAADTIDRPTLQRARLHGEGRVAGAITRTAGFPAHTYVATRTGFVHITLRTVNAHAGDNAGHRWQPYLRIVGEANLGRRGEGWSTNTGSLVIRVAAGDQLTIVATLSENVVKAGTVAEAAYVLTTSEVEP